MIEFWDPKKNQVEETMRKFIGLISCLLFIFLGVVQAHQNDSIASAEFIKCERIDIHPEHIAITPEGIFFQLNDQWLVTDALHRDSRGLFVSSVKSEFSTSWNCPKCGHENSFWRRSCANCGHKPRH